MEVGEGIGLDRARSLLLGGMMINTLGMRSMRKVVATLRGTIEATKRAIAADNHLAGDLDLLNIRNPKALGVLSNNNQHHLAQDQELSSLRELVN